MKNISLFFAEKQKYSHIKALWSKASRCFWLIRQKANEKEQRYRYFSGYSERHQFA